MAPVITGLVSFFNKYKKSGKINVGRRFTVKD
jgi:hypothetical protein